MLSQLDQMRKLILEELLPRVVRRNSKGEWTCIICKTRTPGGHLPDTALHAKHSTYCSLGEALGVIE